MAEPNNPLVGANLNQRYADNLASLTPAPTANPLPPVGAALFNNYANNLLEQKKAGIAEKSAQKKIAMDAGSLATMSPMDKAAAYAGAVRSGDMNTIQALQDNADQEELARTLDNAQRSGMDYTNDVASSLLRGIGNLGSGVAQLALEVTPPAALGNLSRGAGWVADKLGAEGMGDALDEAGNWLRRPTNSARATISDWNKSLQDTAQEQMSLPSRRDIAQSEVAQQADEEVSKAQMDAAGGGAWEQVKRFGRDAASGVGNMIDNPLAAQDMVVQQFPQLATGGLARGAAVANVGDSVASNLLSKAANAAETAAIKKGATLAEAQAARATAERAMTGRAANATRDAVDDLAAKYQVLNIGVQEAGGAADQAAQQVLQMKHDDLMKNSEQYRGYIAQGMSQEDAKNAVAADAGNIAATLQLPLAMVTGKIAARFETNPFGVAGDTAKNRLMAGFQNVGREVLEEIPQSVTGQISSNIGVKATGDNTQDVLEGAGNAASQGLIGALGMSGTVQAPGVIAKPAADALSATLTKARDAVNGVAEYRRTNNADNRGAAADADKAKSDFADAVATFDPTILGDTNAAQTTNPQATTEQTGDLGNPEPGNISTADTAGDVAPVAHENIFSPEGRAIVDALASTGMDDAKQLAAVTQVLDNENLPAEHRRALEIYANDKVGNLLNYLNGPLTQAYMAAEEGSERHTAIGRQMKAINTIMTSKETQRFLEAYNADNLSDEEFDATIAALPAEINAENYNSPEVQKGLQAIKEKSLYRPLDISAEQYQRVLDHDTSLSPMQRQLLEAKKQLADFVATHDTVGKNIRDESRGGFKSVKDHALGVINAMQRKDAQGVQMNLDSLRTFAEKEQARFKEHDRILGLVRGTNLTSNEYTAVPGYFQLDDTGTRLGNKLQFVNATNTKNIEKIESDTNHIVDVYNALLASVPNAQGQSLLHVNPTWKTRGKATPEETAAFQQEVQDRKTAQQNKAANTADANEGTNAQQVQTPASNSDSEVPEAGRSSVESGVPATESEPVPSESRQDAASEPAKSSGTVQPDVVPATYAQSALSEADVQELSDEQISDLMTEAQTHIAEQGYDKTAQDNFRTLSDEMARREAEPVKPEMNVWAGTGENAQFSNLAVRPFTYEGRQYNSVEHAYQSNKSGEFDQATYDKYDMNAKGTVKKIAGRKGTDRNGSQALMETLIRESFQQNPDAHTALRKAGAENTFTHTQDKGYWGKAFPELLQTISNEEVVDNKDNTVESEKAAPIGQQVLAKVQTDLEIPEGADAATRASRTNQLAASMEARPTTRTQYTLGALAEMTLDKLTGLVGKKLVPTDETVSAVKGAQANVSRLANAMEKRMQTRLAKQTKNGTLAETFTNGTTPAWAFPNHKAMYATMVREDGRRSYVPEFKEAASLAAVNWLLSGEDFIANLNAKRAAAMLNMSEDYITQADINRVMEAGVPIPALTRQLATHINSLLGIREKSDSSATYGNHISQALAMEALAAMRDSGLVKFNSLERIDANPVQMVRFAENPDIADIQNKLKGKRDIILKALLPDTPLNGYVLGEPTLEVAQNITGKTWQKLPAKIRKAVEAQQKLPYKINREFINMFAALGSKSLIAAGFYDGDLNQLNKVHRESIEGKNKGLMQATDAAAELLNAVEAYALANNMAPEDVPIHFAYNVDTNGRMRMSGSFNPQSSKVLREMFMATQRDVDMNDPEMMRQFGLHIAQGLGIKVDKKPNDTSLAELETLLTDPVIQDALEAMNHGLNNNWELDADQANAITEAVRGKDNKYLHALLSQAKHDDALSKGQNSFSHSLTFEVDGVTDGPANSFIHFGLQVFNKVVMQLLRQAGWMVNDPTTPYNAVALKQLDLYETASVRIGQLLSDYINELTAKDKNGKLVHPNEAWKAKRPNAIRTLLASMNMATLSTDEDANVSTNLSRAFAKLLVTPATYGSGITSMTRTISNGVLNTFYTQLSDAIAKGTASELNVQMLQAMDMLSKTKQFTALLRATPEQLANFEAQNMEEFHKAFFQELKMPIQVGINDAMGNAPKVNSRVAALANLQSVLFRDAWQQEYVRLHEQRVAEGALAPYEMLSLKDEAAVTKATQHLAPIYQNGISGNDRETGFNMAQMQGNAEVRYLPKSVQRNSRVSDLNESMATEATGRDVAPAGVRSTALSVIAAGDATMMTVFYNAMERNNIVAQNVYDGLDTRIGDMALASDAINNAVATGWGVNVYENMVLEMERVFDNYDWNNASAEAREIADKVLGLEGNIASDQIAYSMKMELLKHRQDAKQNKVIREVLLDTKSAVSHMAGYDTPYVHGSTEYTGTADEVVAAIQDKINARLAETAPEMKTDAAMDTRLREAAQAEKEGPYTLSRATLMNTLSGYDFGGNKVTRALFTRLAPLLPANLEVHVGTFAELEAVRSGRYPNTRFNPNATASTVGSDIFIYQMTPETLFHEAIHAALRGAVANFVTDPASLTETQRSAMANVQSLMNQFLESTPANVDDETQNHVTTAAGQIRRYLDRGDMDGALNEFMAWGLSNQGMQNFLSTLTAAKGTSVKSKLAELVGKLQRAILRVLGFPQAMGMSVLQALAGNVDNLVETMEEAPTVPESTSALNQALDHSTVLPDHVNRLDDMVQRLDTAVGTRVKQTGELLAQNARERTLINGDATKIVDGLKEFLAAGWNLSAKEQHAFKLMQITLASGIQVNPTAMNAMQRLYDSVMPTLTTNDLTQSQLDALKGKGTIFVNGSGRTNQLANFIALGVTSEQFRRVLADRDIPRREKATGDVMDKMSQVTKDMIDWAADLGNGTRSANNAATALDVLAEKIALVNQQAKADLLDAPTTLLGKADGYVADKFQKIGEKAGDAATARILAGKNQTKVDGALNNLLSIIALLDKKGQGQEALQSALNNSKLWTPVVELMTEALGSDKSSVVVNRLLQQAKNQVSAVRQKIRDGVPKNVQAKFTRKLSKEEWATMHRAFGKTDVQSLLSTATLDDVHSYLKDAKALQAAVTAAESAVMKHAEGAAYVVRSKELAHYMMTGENISDHLLRNAVAISELAGTGKAVQGAEKAVESIDHLVTLYAMQQLTDAEKTSMVNLFNTERAGLDFVSNYLKVMNGNEQAKLANYNNLNAFKGHVPSLTVGHKNLVVADRIVGKNLVQNHGYVKVPGYTTDSDLGNNELSYYYTDESLTAGYTQGALQTVEPTVYGTDPLTGRTVHLRGSFGLSGNAARAMARVKGSAIRTAKLGTTPGKLMPIMNYNGEVIGYEAAIPDAVRNEKLGANNNLSEMLGVWQGRQAEESLAQRFNEGLSTKLADIWNSEKGSRKGEYINLEESAKTNKVHKEAWDAIPRAAQDMLKQAFGSDPVMVRKDMLNNAFGYRNFSVSALFTQQSELPQAVQGGIVNLATAILGAKAPRYLRKTGRYTQDAVSLAKDWIIVRSVSVFTMNLLGNFVQLGQNGVGLKAIFKGQAAKMQEVDAYLRNVNKMNQLHSDNLGSTDPVVIKRNKLAIQRLHDANARMSIAPLIAAGELPTVAEGLTIEDDNAIRGGALNWVERISDHVPKGVSDTVKLAMIAKGTPLHNGLNRMMTYGDFTAKAVLFDKLTQQDGLSKEAALKVIQEEFINYDNNPGRARTWFESHGFSWFLTYKLKIQKILLRRMRDNPLSTLVYQGAADGLGIDSPFEANVFGDNFWYSISDPTRALDAPSLHPVAQLLR